MSFIDRLMLIATVLLVTVLALILGLSAVLTISFLVKTIVWVWES